MNRILKKIRTGILAAGFISVSALAMAQNVLSVPGLGTIPLPHDMQLVDGKGSSVEKMFIENTQRPDFGESSQAAFMEIVAIPPGMDLFAEKGTHPFNRAHLYQLQMKKPQGQYTAGVFVVSVRAVTDLRPYLAFPRFSCQSIRVYSIAFWHRVREIR